jgi:CheY-like chemotaxis protein
MKKVLLVEDDPFIRDITAIRLAERNYSVEAAQNGAEALAHIEKEAPDIVLLDLDLPDISGLQIIEKLRSSERCKTIPIIIFSNNDNPDIHEKAKELGIEGFFVKATTSFDDLHLHMESILSR